MDMSDYKRFVAYLYEYQNQAKGENRGFVRVEARNGTCQMGFQLKVFSLPEGSALNVYGFVRIQESLFGIPIGILHSGRNGIAGRLMTPSVHMGDSSFSLNELGGLIIFGPEDRIYATQWDDIPIHPERFTTDTAILQEPSHSEPPSAPQKTEAIHSSSPGNAQASSQPVNASSEPSLSAPQADAASSATQTTAQPNAASGAAHSTAQPNAASGAAHSTAQLNAASGTVLAAAQTAAGTSEETTDNPPEGVSEEELHITSVEAAVPPVINASPAERWQALLDSSPHIHPFDDDEIGECIKIDLKDLPILRKNGWQVGSNQFLLHGFYNYHHLLMGRLSSGKEDTFVFGVPGIFDVKEQFMAGMFGFSAFKPARNSSETAGVSPFGYWYRPVQ